MPPQKGEKKASGRGNEDQGSNGHDRGYVGGRGELILSQTTDWSTSIYFFSISLNVSISALSTRTRMPESSPVETGISTDKNICFPNRRAVRKSSLSSNTVYFPHLIAHPVSSLSKGPRPSSTTATAGFPSLAVSGDAMQKWSSPVGAILFLHSVIYALSMGA
jgi:hypothetical protein